MSGGAGPRVKGNAWERAVRDYFRARGLDAERTYGAGRPDDVGDLVVGAWVPLLVECKNTKESRRALWIDEARRKVDLWKSSAIPIIVEKRRRQINPGRAYVTMELDGLIELIGLVARRVADLDERDVL